jgi:hypothetical protein
VGDVTEEQRKAAIEKAAQALYAAEFGITVHDAEAKWAMHSTNVYEHNVEAALEAVGYFKLVEVAEAVADSWAGFDHDCCLVDMKLLSVLQTLLKEAV